MTRTGLVVAKYKEDISWLSEVPDKIKVYVYDKSGEFEDALDTGHFLIENEGRDPGTFLYHIVKNYDNLDDYTYFAQGWPFDHCGRENFFAKLNSGIEQDYAELGDTVFNVVGNGSLLTGNLELTQVFKAITGKEQLSFEFVWGMQIMLSKRLILCRPKSFYESLLKRTIELYKDTRTLPLMERIWRAIWADIGRELE